MFDPLIWARLIHFAANIAVTGAIFFLGFVAEPAFAAAQAEGGIVAYMRSRLAAISWVGLALTVVSGAAWLLLQAATVADLPVSEALSDGAVWTLLSDTDFGQVWTLRLVIAGTLATSLAWCSGGNPLPSRQKLAVTIVVASALVGTLAWAGHGAAGTGVQGGVHLVADVLHLIAGAAWVGALIPLALLLRAVLTNPDHTSFTIANAAVSRFSTLGIATVATLVASGTVNTWILAGSLPALIETDYGRLLLAKIALFLAMLGLAAVNRLGLTPRLGTGAVTAAIGQVRRNTLIEAGLGAIIIVIISVLGTMPPGLESQAAN